MCEPSGIRHLVCSRLLTAVDLYVVAYGSGDAELTIACEERVVSLLREYALAVKNEENMKSGRIRPGGIP